MQVKKSLGCIIVLFACVGLGLGTYLIIELVLGRPQEPDFITTRIQVPQTVPANEPFEVRMFVQNRASEEIFLHSIDISNTYLEAIDIISISPEPTMEQNIPIVDFTSFSFDQTIPVGGTQTVTFELVGNENGRFNGEVDICVEASVLCKLTVIETEIGAGNGR